MIAAVRVRGDVDVHVQVSRTMQDLKLTKKNRLVVLEDTESIRGMLNKAKDYVAFGELGEDMIETLEDRKGSELEPGDTFDLAPPTGGFANTKKQFGQGGTLGDHGEIDHLVGRMV